MSATNQYNGGTMKQGLDFGYSKNLNELKSLARNVDLSDKDYELITKSCENILRGVNFNYSVYCKDNKYYINTADGGFEMKLLRTYKIDNEANRHKTEMIFEFTPDLFHIWRVEIFKNDIYDWNIGGIEALSLPANEDFIHCGDFAEYNGIKLQFDAEDHITISKADKSFSMKVKEDDDKVYGFRKRLVYAKHGAYGLFSFMENIAEQAKINRVPFWSSAYMIMDQFVA